MVVHHRNLYSSDTSTALKWSTTIHARPSEASQSCHKRAQRGAGEKICKKYDRVHYTTCHHELPTATPGLEWWENWTSCDACARYEHAGLAEAHWKERANKHDAYEPGAKRVGYPCPRCWGEVIAPSQWGKLERAWRHRLAPSDWAVLAEWKEYLVLGGIHPTRRGAGWCCDEAIGVERGGGEVHDEFYCRMKEALERGRRRKAEVEQGRPFEPLWVKPERHVPEIWVGAFGFAG